MISSLMNRKKCSGSLSYGFGKAWDLERWNSCLVHLQASVSCETAWTPQERSKPRVAKMLLWMAQKLFWPLGRGLFNLPISFAIEHPLAEVEFHEPPVSAGSGLLLPWLPERERACWAHHSAQGLSTHCVDLAAAPSNVQLRTPPS